MFGFMLGRHMFGSMLEKHNRINTSWLHINACSAVDRQLDDRAVCTEPGKKRAYAGGGELH